MTRNFFGREESESKTRLRNEVIKDKSVRKSARRHYFPPLAKLKALRAKSK